MGSCDYISNDKVMMLQSFLRENGYLLLGESGGLVGTPIPQDNMRTIERTPTICIVRSLWDIN